MRTYELKYKKIEVPAIWFVAVECFGDNIIDAIERFKKNKPTNFEKVISISEIYYN